MAPKRAESGILHRGERVVAVETIGAVKKGTHGVVQMVAGFSWIRYWVKWETGPWTGSVDGKKVIREGEFADYERRLADGTPGSLSTTPVAAGALGVAGVAGSSGQRAAATPAADGYAAGGAAGATSAIPDHLLKRAEAARARKAAQQSESGT